MVLANTHSSAYLEVTPTELEGGGVVIFTVKATNYLNEAYSVKGYVVDEDGVTIKDITATLPADAYDYTLTSFSLQVSSVGNHTYTLFLDNYDGNPGGLDEEHWDSVSVIVEPEENVIASMNCNSSVALGESVQCTVHFELESAGTVTLNLEGVDFGGKKVWPNGPSSVKVSKQTVTLTPTNMQEDLAITIDINDELANYYFEKEPLGWGSYSDRLAGYSYLVRAVFSDGIVTSGIVGITDKSSSLGEKVETAVETIGMANSVLQKVAEYIGQLETVVSGPLGKVVAKVTPILNFISWGLTMRDVINWARAPTPSDGDNNNVIGG